MAGIICFLELVLLYSPVFRLSVTQDSACGAYNCTCTHLLMPKTLGMCYTTTVYCMSQTVFKSFFKSSNQVSNCFDIVLAIYLHDMHPTSKMGKGRFKILEKNIVDCQKVVVLEGGSILAGRGQIIFQRSTLICLKGVNMH